MRLTTQTWLVVLAVLVAGAAVGAGAMWMAQDARVAKAEDQRKAAEDDLRRARERISTLEAEAEIATQPAGSDGATAATGSDETPLFQRPTASKEDGRYFCYVKSVSCDQAAAKVRVDYAEFLTGKKAADAAAAAGEESPPPNDFFISNQNPKLRTFAVERSLKVKMVSKADDIVIEGYPMSFLAWCEAFNGGPTSFPAIKVVPYWITIKDGVVTGIEEQYIP